MLEEYINLLFLRIIHTSLPFFGRIIRRLRPPITLRRELYTSTFAIGLHYSHTYVAIEGGGQRHSLHHTLWHARPDDIGHFAPIMNVTIYKSRYVGRLRDNLFEQRHLAKRMMGAQNCRSLTLCQERLQPLGLRLKHLAIDGSGLTRLQIG